MEINNLLIFLKERMQKSKINRHQNLPIKGVPLPHAILHTIIEINETGEGMMIIIQMNGQRDEDRIEVEKGEKKRKEGIRECPITEGGMQAETIKKKNEDAIED
jgi:hypothetical protein